MNGNVRPRDLMRRHSYLLASCLTVLGLGCAGGGRALQVPVRPGVVAVSNVVVAMSPDATIGKWRDSSLEAWHEQTPERIDRYRGVMGRALRDAMKATGYSVVRLTSSVESTASDIVLVPAVTGASIQNVGEQYLSRAEVFLEVQWTAFDRRSGQILFQLWSRAKAQEDTDRDAFTSALLLCATSVLGNDSVSSAWGSQHGFRQIALTDAADVVELDLPELVDSSKASVYTIQRYTTSGRVSHGTAFAISGGGWMLSSAHVVAPTSAVSAIESDGGAQAAVVWSIDPHRDVALLKLANSWGTNALPIRWEPLSPGTEISIVGTPLDWRLSLSVTRGVVSGVRTLDGLSFLQMDAAANPGNSGGPVVDVAGAVVGVVVSKVVGSDVEGVAFAVPIESALSAVGVKR